jgi:DNA-binding transcriptional LysR family regulator
MADDHKFKPVLMPDRAAGIALQHLRYAISASEHGSFRRAAEALRLRQSTLSRCIRQLELSIGLTVFERSSGGVRATTAGRKFLRMARSILEQMEALVSTAHGTGRGEVGRLAIGFYTSLSAENLRATLLDYAQRFPQIELGMIEASRTHLATALRNGALDIAIVTGELPLLDNNVLPLWSERVVVTLPQDHALVAKDTVYITDLRGETALLSQHDPGPDLQELLMARLTSPEDRPRIVRHDVSGANIKSLVGAGVGVSLMIESCVGASFSGLIYRELRDGTGPCRIGYSAHWREDNDNPALLGFLKLLSERYPLPPVADPPGASSITPDRSP